MKQRFGLRPKFALFILSLFIVLFGVAATLLVTRKASSGRSSLNEGSKSFATLATKPVGDAFLLYKDSGQIRIQQQIAKFTDLDPDVTGVSIANTSGKVVFTSGQTPTITKDQAMTFEPVYLTRNGTIGEAIVPLVEDYGLHRYSIIYSISDQRLAQDIKRTVVTIILLSVAGFALAMLITYRLIDGLFLSPVRTISRKALKISGGDLEDQIQLNRHDELGDLATSVNTMANSLKADITKLQEADTLKSEFITIASHNLRTPLTAIKGNLELMEYMDVPADVQESVEALSTNTARLDNFIEDLLAISTVEAGKLDLHSLSPTPIKPLLQSIADNYEPVAKQNNIGFQTALNIADEQVVMSKPQLKIALVNLLENAFKFTKEGSVSFGADVNQGSVVIRIADTGIGIAPAELPKLFTKFHRGTSVMEYNYEGTGIGLYLTKLIVTAHHGSIDVGSLEGKGTTFTVKLPLAA